MSRFSFLSILLVMLFSLTQSSATAQNCSCAGDFNSDGFVNGADVVLFLPAMGTQCTGCCQDINNDGFVNGADLVLFLGDIGLSCDNQNDPNSNMPNDNTISAPNQEAPTAYRNSPKGKKEDN